MPSDLKKVPAGRKFFGSILMFSLFALLFLLLAVVSPLWHYFVPAEKDLDQKRAAARIAKREALEKENEQKLTTYAWVNKDKGIVQIPIDRAMQLVVADLNAKPVKASDVKLENPYPYGLQDLSFAPTPAPAASGTAAKPAAKPAATGTAAPAASGTAAKPAASGTAAPSATGTAAPPPPPAAPTPAP